MHQVLWNNIWALLHLYLRSKCFKLLCFFAKTFPHQQFCSAVFCTSDTRTKALLHLMMRCSLSTFLLLSFSHCLSTLLTILYLFQSLTIIQIKRIKRFSASIRGEIWLRGAHCKQFAVWTHCKKRKHLLCLHFLYMADLMKDRHRLICNAGFSIFPDD